MRKLLPRVLLGIAAGVAIYVGFSIWAGARTVGQALASFSWASAAAALGLAAANYLVRFVRWQYYLRVLGLSVPTGESLLVFLGGFALTVTPGKLGEAVKALLLREFRGIPAARTAPIVLAERFTDLVGLLMLAGLGLSQLDNQLRNFLLAGSALVAVGLLVISVESLAKGALAMAARLPGFAKVAPKLSEAYQSTATMLRPGPLLVAIALSVVAWFFECLAFWVVVHGFEGASISLLDATWIYAAMTVAGALSFLPGGLGVSELAMLKLLQRFGAGTGLGVATAATFVTRLCTLWFAVAVGVISLLLFARRTNVRIELPASSRAASADRS